MTIGTGVGLVLAAFGSRLLSDQLFGVQPFDISTMASATAILVAIAGLAVFVPARRAARLDPTPGAQARIVKPDQRRVRVRAAGREHEPQRLAGVRRVHLSQTCSGVPVATTRPPASPPSGPRSMT